MRLRYALPLAGILAAAVLVAARWYTSRTPPSPATASGRPNVVLLSLDTTRADHLGCYGYPRPTSPNLDRLAGRGVRYARASSQASWTFPSHMSLFTSMVPSHCQVEHLVSVLSPEIPTLAEILRGQGYHTAGIVNDGQMSAKLGCNRGFKDWLEFPAQTPDGNCARITDAALRWLAAAPAEPFLLFLHYYDAHTPYEPPDEFRRRFGSAISGPETARRMRRRPERRPANHDAEAYREVIGSYDGAIAWLDSQLARLFARLPKNTLIVVFADHGEAFQEHGWTLHGAGLYEEEIHVPLLMSMPDVLPEGQVVDDPVMLIDVAPSILALCGAPVPAHCEGCDLAPTWSGARLPKRPILAETKVHYEAQALKMVALDDWKLIRSVLDGREELYHLPDEQTDRSSSDTPVHQVLSDLARRWIAEEDFWTIHARGPGQFNATLTPRSGQFLCALRLGDYQDGSVYGIDVNGRSFDVRWPLGERSRGLFVQVAPADAALHLDCEINGKRRPELVFTGKSRAHPARLPTDLALSGAEVSDPVGDRPFTADRPGFYIYRHVGQHAGRLRAHARTLDAQTIRRLESLGYLR